MSKEDFVDVKVLYKLLSENIESKDMICARLLSKISTAITKARLELGMSQEAFAQFILVSQGMVSKWESEDYNFTIKTLSNIADRLNWNIDINIETATSRPMREVKCKGYTAYIPEEYHDVKRTLQFMSIPKYKQKSYETNSVYSEAPLQTSSHINDRYSYVEVVR